ncbi:MAG: sulfide/dihydroorotate dehydrogenase-like FAD/NAD-binding protein [Candidatus Hadarchaeales archaeon]
MGYKILSAEPLAPQIVKLEIEAPHIARKAKPGHFLIVRLTEKGERVPLTIVDANPQRGSVTIVVLEAGKTTKLMQNLKPGQEILNCVGPLGNPTEIKYYGTVACVGGGVGVACIYPVARALKQAGNRVLTLIGARTERLLIFEHELRQWSDELLVSTDDGSRGHRGFVHELLQKVLERGEKLDLVYAVGPVLMMKAVAEVTRPLGIKTIVSLNPIMVDGTGMCGSCRVEVGGQMRFACVDGPEFDAHQVDFDLLLARNRRYLDQEKMAMDTLVESSHQSIKA